MGRRGRKVQKNNNFKKREVKEEEISPFSSIVLKEKAEARKEERREKTGSEIVGGYDPDASFADILNAYEKTGNPYALKKAKAVEEPTDFASIFEKWENRGKKKEVKEAPAEEALKPPIPLMQGIKFIPSSKDPASPVRINNESNILFDFAKCCNPVYGDEIVAYISRGRGYVIHRKDCKNLANMAEADKRLVPVVWDSHELVRRFKVTAKMNAELFGEIDGAVKKYNGRLIAGSLDVSAEGLSGTFTVSANNEVEMRRMLSSIRSLPSIIKIQGTD